MFSIETRGRAAVVERKGATHRLYEDRYRLLTDAIPLVKEAGRGEVVAVFDGVGGAPMGMRAAQFMADSLIDFFQDSKHRNPNDNEFVQTLREANNTIFNWGMMEGSYRPLGAAPGTVAWLRNGSLLLLHCGDTEAFLRTAHGEIVDLLEEQERTNTVVDYFGKGPSLELSVKEIEVADGDRILLFSDGVRKSVPQSIIESAMAEPTPESAVRCIGERAETVNATDDATAVLFEIALKASPEQ